LNFVIAGLGHQVYATLCEWMAPRQAAQREPRSALCSVNSHSVRGVMRAGGIKLAGARHERGKKRLVNAHEQKQQTRRPAHSRAQVAAKATAQVIVHDFGAMPRSRRTNSAARGAKGASATEGRG